MRVGMGCNLTWGGRRSTQVPTGSNSEGSRCFGTLYHLVLAGLDFKGFNDLEGHEDLTSLKILQNSYQKISENDEKVHLPNNEVDDLSTNVKRKFDEGHCVNIEKRRRKNTLDLNSIFSTVSCDLNTLSPPLFQSARSLLEMLIDIYKEDFPTA